MKFNPPLFALAVGAFGIGTTEFAPMGLLTIIAADLHVTIPRAGLLVSGYAIGVLLGAPLLTLTTTKLPRKTLLMGLMVLFTLGNLLAAISTGYAMLFAARIVTSLCHGAFFGVGSVVAAGLVAPDRRAGAVAAMFAGLTIANIGGVPLAAWVGQTIGWRAAFGGIAGLGVIALACLQFALPSIAAGAAEDPVKSLAVIRRPAVLIALATTALGSAAMFTVFTYISAILREVTRVGPNVITTALIVYGVGLTIGNQLGGRFADRALRTTLIVVLVSLAALLLMFAVTMHQPIAAIATIFAWGIATFALVPPLQSRVMQVAREAPDLAASVNIGAFNLGNAIGAALGGGVIAAGFGYPWVAVAGAGTALGGLVCVLFTRFDQA